MPKLQEKVRRSSHAHPYLSGNFAPIHRIQALTPCSYTGRIPKELAGGQYVRNGGNPVTNEDLGRDAHWFDGDGMLSGVSFARKKGINDEIEAEFVNRYVLTDVFISSMTSQSLQTPILPSIATLVNPLSSLVSIILRIFRTIFLVVLSHLSGSKQAIQKISVANTAIIYHDGRALATCESGPPMRVSLPSLDTIGWFNGKKAEGEYEGEEGSGFGGKGLLSFMKEWTTAHPRVDPDTSELLLFHSTFAPPYVHYSIIPSTSRRDSKTPGLISPRLISVPVAGVKSAKMMHDFGVSHIHTVIMDLPLSLDPLNLGKNKPVVAYDPTKASRFGVFPRYQPGNVRWFETKACCIFHTANTWDTVSIDTSRERQQTTDVNMLACRLTSASLVFSAGDIAAPIPVKSISTENLEEEQCRLYYYQFPLLPASSTNGSPYSQDSDRIAHQWALSAVPFEFPSLRESMSMSAAKYIYGCTSTDSAFGAALGRAVKIDALVKMDVETLIKRGKDNPPTQITGCVDSRGVMDILASQDPHDPIRVFKMPEGWYAQEPRFVPRENGVGEDDGWLLTYVFDESQVGSDGECLPTATSELWIIDAKDMRDVITRVRLPQRVPYGLHGNWFSEEKILNQRPVKRLRTFPSTKGVSEQGSAVSKMWMGTRGAMERFLA